ncbi:MAG: TlpA disulfide reductase family protein [Chromatiales bacterium]|jgi:thiol-disulfide isomerase/thioredoxin
MTLADRNAPMMLVLLLLLAAGARADPLDLSLRGLDGTQVRLSDHRGAWVVLNFWASWCEPCRDAIPELVHFHDEHPNVMVLGISLEDTDPGTLRGIVAELGMDYPVALAGDAPVQPFEPLKGLPTTVVIDPQGELAAFHTGPVSAEGLSQFIAACRR